MEGGSMHALRAALLSADNDTLFQRSHVASLWYHTPFWRTLRPVRTLRTSRKCLNSSSLATASLEHKEDGAIEHVPKSTLGTFCYRPAFFAFWNLKMLKKCEQFLLFMGTPLGVGTLDCHGASKTPGGAAYFRYGLLMLMVSMHLAQSKCVEFQIMPKQIK